jgi:hypothetical protein
MNVWKFLYAPDIFSCEPRVPAHAGDMLKLNEAYYISFQNKTKVIVNTFVHTHIFCFRRILREVFNLYSIFILYFDHVGDQLRRQLRSRLRNIRPQKKKESD